MLDAPKMINIVIDICKVFLSKKIKDVIQTQKSEVYFADDGDLPKELIPQNFGGTANDAATMKSLEEMLKTRAESEQNFKL